MTSTSPEPRLAPSSRSGTVRGEEESRAAGLARAFGRLARGDVEALEAVYDLAADELYGLALWRLADPAAAGDVVQEVFVRLAETSAKLETVRDPRAYLLTMAHRLTVDRHRESARSAPLESDPSPGRDAHRPSDLLVPQGDPERRAEARRASRRLRELPPAQREALYLRHFAGLSFAEIGRATRVPTFTAASRCRLGLARLRRLLRLEENE